MSGPESRGHLDSSAYCVYLLKRLLLNTAQNSSRTVRNRRRWRHVILLYHRVETQKQNVVHSLQSPCRCDCMKVVLQLQQVRAERLSSCTGLSDGPWRQQQHRPRVNSVLTCRSSRPGRTLSGVAVRSSGAPFTAIQQRLDGPGSTQTCTSAWQRVFPV